MKVTIIALLCTLLLCILPTHSAAFSKHVEGMYISCGTLELTRKAGQKAAALAKERARAGRDASLQFTGLITDEVNEEEKVSPLMKCVVEMNMRTPSPGTAWEEFSYDEYTSSETVYVIAPIKIKRTGYMLVERYGIFILNKERFD